jgi:hypothetical protein
MVAFGAGAVLIFLLSYLPRLDRVIGLMGDDGWYVLLAKSLATGQGYQLINSPTPGILPIYPPAFPFLISLAYRAWPQFPNNILLLKLVSIIAMFGVGWLTYIHFVIDRKVPRFFGLGLALATATSPAFVFLATSTVMSECVFLCGQLATVVAIERAVRQSEKSGWRFWKDWREGYGRGWQWTLLGAALASFTFLTRTIGITLVMAIVLYLLKERLFPLAALFAIVVTLLVGPWIIYERLHAPTPEQTAEQNSYIVKGYGAQAEGIEKHDAPESNFWIKHIWRNTAWFVENHFGALSAYPWFRAAEPAVGKGRTVNKAIVSIILGVITIIGFILAARARVTSSELIVAFTTVIAIVWIFFSFRFVLPLAPWLFFYLALGFQALCRSLTQPRRRTKPYAWGWAAAAVWVIVAINGYGNASYIYSLYRSPAERPVWLTYFAENEATLQWVNEHTPNETIITTSFPSLVYLYTGRKTVGFANPLSNWERWKKMGIRYSVFLSYYPLSDSSDTLKKFDILYQSNEMKLKVVDFGDASSRTTWSVD